MNRPKDEIVEEQMERLRNTRRPMQPSWFEVWENLIAPCILLGLGIGLCLVLWFL